MQNSVTIYEPATNRHVGSIQFDAEQVPTVGEQIVIASKSDDPPRKFSVREVIWLVVQEKGGEGTFDGPVLHVEPIV